jgi:Protein of unknown function (DUF2793)
MVAGWAATENTWGAPMNHNMRLADLLCGSTPVISLALTAPPGTPAEGDAYIPATGASGAWSGQAGILARWYNAGPNWEFFTPKVGWTVQNAVDGRAWRYSGVLWVPVSGGRNPQTGTAYTLALADAAALVEMNNAAANACTVPPNSSVPFPLYTRIQVAQAGAGITTLVAGAGVTLLQPSTLAISAQNGVAALEQTAANTWRVTGNLT